MGIEQVHTLFTETSYGDIHLNVFQWDHVYEEWKKENKKGVDEPPKKRQKKVNMISGKILREGLILAQQNRRKGEAITIGNFLNAWYEVTGVKEDAVYEYIDQIYMRWKDLKEKRDEMHRKKRSEEGPGRRETGSEDYDPNLDSSEDDLDNVN
jgi:hypothetical protein